jgi:hypothetical protein
MVRIAALSCSEESDWREALNGAIAMEFNALRGPDGAAAGKAS